jgi:hypothetical protein
MRGPGWGAPPPPPPGRGGCGCCGPMFCAMGLVALAVAAGVAALLGAIF